MFFDAFFSMQFFSIVGAILSVVGIGFTVVSGLWLLAEKLSAMTLRRYRNTARTRLARMSAWNVHTPPTHETIVAMFERSGLGMYGDNYRLEIGKVTKNSRDEMMFVSPGLSAPADHIVGWVVLPDPIKRRTEGK